MAVQHWHAAFPQKTNQTQEQQCPWPLQDQETLAAFRRHLLETQLIFGVCFTCSEELVLQWTEPYLLY